MSASVETAINTYSSLARKTLIEGPAVATREPQYGACFSEPPVTLGAMAGSTWRWNPRRLGFVLARYKFVAQMLRGRQSVAEIGCADGFASVTVRDVVGSLYLYDFDPVWIHEARRFHPPYRVLQSNIVEQPLTAISADPYDGIYMLDVLEHISPADEPAAMANIVASLATGGAFIAGVPSAESQVYANEISRAGHVNCRSGEKLRSDLSQYFRNVFLFGMNDEVLHVGFAPMCHYLFALCTEPRA
jgi:hypothetical protein